MRWRLAFVLTLSVGFCSYTTWGAPAGFPAAIVATNHGVGTTCFVNSQWWTADHNVARDEEIGWHSPPWSAKGKVLSHNPDKDLALLTVEGAPPQEWLEISDRKLHPGDPVTIYGWTPLIPEPLVIHGWYLGKSGDGLPLVDGFIWPGLSGSCVVDDANGKLIGIAGGTMWPSGEGLWRPAIVVREIE